jgi:tetratricopeptide (TPR) repeat protein
MASLFMEMASGITRLGKIKNVADWIAMSAEWRHQAQSDLAAIHEASPEEKYPQTEALLAFTESQSDLMRGLYDHSLEMAKKACELDPTNAKYQFAVANILQVLGDRDENASVSSDEIVAYAKKAVELEPEVWRYLMFYGGQLRELGQLRDSYEVLKKIHDVTNKDEVLREVDDILAALEAAIQAESNVMDSSQK